MSPDVQSNLTVFITVPWKWIWLELTHKLFLKISANLSFKASLGLQIAKLTTEVK